MSTRPPYPEHECEGCRLGKELLINRRPLPQREGMHEVAAMHAPDGWVCMKYLPPATYKVYQEFIATHQKKETPTDEPIDAQGPEEFWKAWAKVLENAGADINSDRWFKFVEDYATSLKQPTPADPFSKGYKHREGGAISDACGDGKHSQCTQDFTKCHCTMRGGHTVAHAYAELPAIVDKCPQCGSTQKDSFHTGCRRISNPWHDNKKEKP